MKSPGAKTNHLPNIQGSAGRQALQNGPETGIFAGNPGPKTVRKIEVTLTPSGRRIGPKTAILPAAGPPISARFRLEFARKMRLAAAYSAAKASSDFGFAADIMKSLMRGTISERKREPLNTP